MSDTNIWRRLIAGQLKCRELPKELDLSACDAQAGLSEIHDDIERLWQSTAQDGKERGACIVLDHDRLNLDHEVVGTPWSVQLMHRVGDYGDHIGVFHTHPLYPNGSEQVGFSHMDFAGALEDDERLSVVRSGNHVFALVRTNRTRPPVQVSQQEKDEFFTVFQYYYDKNLPQPEAQRRANYHLCCWLGFAFYTGEFGNPLKRELSPTLRGKLMSFLSRTLMLFLKKGVIL